MSRPRAAPPAHACARAAARWRNSCSAGSRGRRHRLDRGDETPLLGQRQQHQRNAAHHAADPPVPVTRQQVGQIAASPSITRTPGNTPRRCVGHLRHDLDHDQPFRRHAAFQQRPRDHAGAGPEFQHRLVRRRVCVCRTIRRHSAAEEGITEPICNGFASQRRKNIAGLAMPRFARAATSRSRRCRHSCYLSSS